MKSMTRTAGMLSGVESLRFVLKSIIGIVLARMLSLQDYGSYRQLFLIYTSFSTILLVGLPQTMLYFIPKLKLDQEKSQYICRIVDFISVLGMIFGLLILIFGGEIAARFANPELKKLLLLFAAYPVFMFVNQIYSFIMLGLKRTQSAMRFSLLAASCDLILILGVAVLTRDLTMIVLAVLLSAFIQWVYVRWQLRAYSSSYQWDPDFYKAQLRYSLPLGLSSIIGILAIQLDKFVISGVFTPAQFAVFSIGAMELPFIGILNYSVNSVILPHLSASGEKSEALRVYRGSIRKNALLIFPVAVLSFILATDVLTLLYGSDYAAATPYFRVYLGILLVRIASYGVIFQALGKTKYILYNAIFTLVGNLILNLILVRTALGMMGPAVATVIITYASTALYLWWIHRKLSMDLNLMFPWLQLGRTMFAALLAGLLVAVLLPWFGSFIFRIIAGGLLYLGAYLGAGHLTKAIIPYDIDNLKAFGRELSNKWELFRGR
ncbi:MAG: oligosaccharide flippase family protein [Candidatus Cloacimonetes bacterium]|jgi:O-antigen/teichoic acid export membrane protein|nr:oligosaccharide flippase family protein [Candidatus Cloacimonadota bacterium]